MNRLGIKGVLLAVLLTTQVQAYSGGSGTHGDPYQIATYDDLVALARTPEDYDQCFILTADIECDSLISGRDTSSEVLIAPCETDYDGPEDVGFFVEDSAFTGRFDGNGHVIRNLNFLGSGSHGLFGVVGEGAWIGHLGLEDVCLTGSDGTAALAISVESACIEDCYSTGTIEAQDAGLVGGLIGYCENSVILNCSSSCQIEASECVGGLVAQISSGLVLGCQGIGEVTGDSWSGGLIGYNHDATICECQGQGSVTGDYCVGGLLGNNVAGVIRQSYATNEVSGRERVGGLVGSHGEDENEEEGFVGGLIENCYCTGAVSGQEAVGGFVGYHAEESLISCCYSTGAVTGEEFVGGWVGKEDFYEWCILDCFWDVETSGFSTSSAGTGLSTALMETQQSFTDEGWDFVGESDNGLRDLWQMPAEGGAPVLVNSLAEVGEVAYEGQGTRLDPYRITSVEQLRGMVQDPLAYYQLDQDLDLTGHCYSTALIPWFNGSLDGKGHALDGMSLAGAGWMGLFAMLGSDAYVRNVRLSNVEMMATSVPVYYPSPGQTEPVRHEKAYCGSIVGMLAAYSQGTVQGCAVSGDLDVARGSGGLLGRNDGRVISCYSEGTVQQQYSTVGGLVGDNQGSIYDSYSTASVSGSNYVGGLVGDNVYGSIHHSYFCGELSSTDLFSWNGDLVGRNQLSVSYFLSTYYYIGQISQSFWERESWISSSSGPGTGLTSDQLQDKATLLAAGWDFVGETANGTADYWDMNEAGGYPVLRIFAEATDVPWEGEGTSEEPYQIQSLTGLGRVWERPQSCYCLDADLDCNAITWQTAVIPWFSGSFDGNDHSISHLTMQGGGSLGFVGLLDTQAEITSLALPYVDVNGTVCTAGSSFSLPLDYYNTLVFEVDWSRIISPGAQNVGALAGLNRGRISQCQSSGYIKAIHRSGGLVGTHYGHLDHSCATWITLDGEANLGGLVGWNSGDIEQCYSRGQIRGTQIIGGLAGRLYSGVVSNSYSKSRCLVEGDEDEVGVAGLVGYHYGGVVRTCYSAGYPDELVYNDDRYGTVEDSPSNSYHADDFDRLLGMGWDFVGETDNGTDDIWVMQSGYYPRLAWEGIDPNQIYSGGSGTPSDPYLLSTVEDFFFLSENKDDWDKHLSLTSDLDLCGIVWVEAPISPTDIPDDVEDVPWSRGEYDFVGFFDGNGHVIRNLTIKGVGGLGLFGVIWNTGCVHNLGLEDVDISGTGSGVGALAERVYWKGQVTQCYSTGSVDGLNYVGGLIGLLHDDTVLDDSYSWASVKGQYYVGGLAGYNGEYQMYCYSTGPVEGSQVSGGRSGRTGRSLAIVEPNALWQWYDGGFEPYDYDDDLASYTLEQMWDVNTYLAQGWDFMGEADNGLHDIWQMPAEGGFPVLTVFQANNPFTTNGSGSVEDPYIISTAAQLGAMRQHPYSHYRLNADLDLDGITWHQAVMPEFGGTFDGQGHVIENLTIVGWDYLGLFGHLYEEAEVQRVGIVDVNISGVVECLSDRDSRRVRVTDTNNCSLVMVGGEYCGALAGRSDGAITNCFATGSIEGGSGLGGLIGSGYGLLTNCYSVVVMRDGYGSYGSGVGGKSDYTTGCFWDTEVSGVLEDDGATGLTTAEMQDINTYLNAGWDFVNESDNGSEDIWMMPDEPGYPVLCQE